MAQSLSKAYVHITFSTKNRYPFIGDNIEKELWSYIGGICKALECYPIRVGGHNDHVHVCRKRSFKEELIAFLKNII